MPSTFLVIMSPLAISLNTRMLVRSSEAIARKPIDVLLCICIVKRRSPIYSNSLVTVHQALPVYFLLHELSALAQVKMLVQKAKHTIISTALIKPVPPYLYLRYKESHGSLHNSQESAVGASSRPLCRLSFTGGYSRRI